MRVVAGAAILGSILGGCHKGPHEMRCTNRVDVEANVPVAATKLNGDTIAVCLNSDCLQYEVREISPMRTNSTLYSAGPPVWARSIGHSLVALMTPKESTTNVRAILYPFSPNGRDTWRMTVVDENGSTLFDASRTAVHVREVGSCLGPNWMVELSPPLTADLTP